MKNKITDITGYSPNNDTIKRYLDNLQNLDFTSPMEESKDKGPIDSHSAPNEKNVHVYSVRNAKARMAIQGGSYIILKDSTARKEERESIPDNARRMRKKLIEMGALVDDEQNNLYRFTRNVPFKSPSAASNVISASMTGGPKCFNIPGST